MESEKLVLMSSLIVTVKDYKTTRMMLLVMMTKINNIRNRAIPCIFGVKRRPLRCPCFPP